MKSLLKPPCTSLFIYLFYFFFLHEDQHNGNTAQPCFSPRHCWRNMTACFRLLLRYPLFGCSPGHRHVTMQHGSPAAWCAFHGHYQSEIRQRNVAKKFLYMRVAQAGAHVHVQASHICLLLWNACLVRKLDLRSSTDNFTSKVRWLRSLPRVQEPVTIQITVGSH